MRDGLAFGFGFGIGVCLVYVVGQIASAFVAFHTLGFAF